MGLAIRCCVQIGAAGISFEGAPTGEGCWAANAEELLSFADGGAGGVVANGSDSGRARPGYNNFDIDLARLSPLASTVFAAPAPRGLHAWY